MLKSLLWLVFSFCFLPLHLFSVELSVEERAYLKSLEPIKACVDPDWAPFETLNSQGVYEGIGADLLSLVAKRLDTVIEVLPTKDWDESMVASKEGRCLIVSFLNQTPARSKWLIFSESHFSDVNVFITREEHSFISNPADLVDKTIVFPKGTAMEELIRKDYPNLTILTTDTEIEAFQMVSDKKADMTMRSLIVAAYTIKQKGFFNLKISGQLPNYTNQLRIGVIKEHPMLRDILSKAILSITPKEREAIVNQHIVIQAQTVMDRSMAVKISIVFIVIIFAFVYRQYELKRYNTKLLFLSQTDLLTNLHNRTKISQLLDDEIERSKRSGEPFSIFLMDIDFFKKVNDTFGHQIGDLVLIQFSKSAKECLRRYDTIGRWGGEEFLVLCPNTDKKEALQVAERLRLCIYETSYATKLKHSVSIGVATLGIEDTSHTLVSKADNVLYKAKNEGRNKVCASN